MVKTRRVVIVAVTIPLTLLAIATLVFSLLKKETFAGTDKITPLDIFLQIGFGIPLQSSSVPTTR